MAIRLLSFPFRFNPGQPSSFVTNEFETNEYKAQQIEGFMLTQTGQRPIFSDFGIEDPTFSGGNAGFDDTTFVSEFATFYDNISLDRVTIVGSEGALSKIEIEFN
jgi:hypothetical protein